MQEPLAYSIASTQKRMVSFVIDDIVVSLFFIAIFYSQLSELFANITEVDEAALQGINAFISQNILVIFAVKIVYHTLFVWQNGMTLGKYVMRIKVVETKTGYTPSFQVALLRASIRIASEVLFYLGFLLAFFMPLKQTLHDALNGCVVVDG